MKKLVLAFCIIALMTACKKEQQTESLVSKPVIEGGLSITIEKGQLSNNSIVYSQTPAWLSVWNTHGHVLDIWPTDALQGITNDKTANKTITADYHNTQATAAYHLKLDPGTYMVFVILSLPNGSAGQYAYSYKTFTVTSTSGYVEANKKFGCNIANAAFESWN